MTHHFSKISTLANTLAEDLLCYINFALHLHQGIGDNYKFFLMSKERNA